MWYCQEKDGPPISVGKIAETEVATGLACVPSKTSESGLHGCLFGKKI